MNNNIRLTKNTFWNRVRVSKGIKIREVAEMFDVSEAIAGLWFSGQKPPKTAIQCQLCDLFDVDYETGINNFTNDHKIWKNERGRFNFITEEDLEIMKSTKKASKQSEQPGTSGAKIRYSTPWNIRRQESGISIADLAAFLNLAKCTVSTFFSGRAMPSDKHIQMLCGLFNGLDFDTGKQDFIAGHEMWLSENPDTRNRKKSCTKVAPTTEEIVETFNTTPGGCGPSSEGLIEYLIDFVYGKINRTDFLAFSDAISRGDSKALDIIYGKLPSRDFILINNKFNEIKL